MASKPTKPTKKGKENSLSLLVEVFCLFLGLCVHSIRGGGGRTKRRMGLVERNASNFELQGAVWSLMESAQRTDTKKNEGDGGEIDWESLGSKPVGVLQGGDEGEKMGWGHESIRSFGGVVTRARLFVCLV